MKPQNKQMHCRFSPRRTCNPCGYKMKISSRYHRLLIYGEKGTTKIDGMGPCNFILEKVPKKPIFWPKGANLPDHKKEYTKISDVIDSKQAKIDLQLQSGQVPQSQK